jgi:hypothetical protein
MIPTINRVVHREWPQIECRLFGPMKDRVQHHCTRPRGDCLGGSFSGTILMICTNAGEGDRLTLVLEITIELNCVKRCVVSSECLDLDVEFSQTLLKSILALQCFSDSQGNLMMVVHEARVTIDEDGASCDLLLGILFTEYSREAARQDGDVLIEMDHVALDGCGIVQVVFLLVFACVKNLRGRCRRMTSLAQSASSTLRFRARG